MDTTLSTSHAPAKTSVWSGGVRPFNISYGKMMMWFFILSDFFTFMGFLFAYTALKSSHPDWPNPDYVFKGFPLMGHHFNAPLLFVGTMTFILIVSSFTMVIAVDAGHRRDYKKTVKYMILTILGGAVFLSCQAWEWSHLIHGVKLSDTTVKMIKDTNGNMLRKEVPYAMVKLTDGIITVTPHTAILVKPLGEKITEEAGKAFTVSTNATDITLTPIGNNKPSAWMEFFNEGMTFGSTLTHNPFGQPLFSSLFFLVTGFHGFHVFSGLVILVIIAFNVYNKRYESRGHYEMVEKAGLYWHFVDLVWVFVFTFFYLLK
ncbi:MAG: hypothetical protein A3H98_06560 [Bacteroidetes bacterium RIFCSPLOWO2_02_FULL_36_8]|nr:MAG: hypothetical protein A3H98_06560 [Bacteroidetes bacterium RIFCSPLOWO2_02_FULL_36_8]OFY71126.1 MAG: hypothetical protein A3G23_15070 [Bacteroidetes bacterium RIFCSPLOWO2_12_FULL_37_12]